jgi:uncharacterized damage-inducible protein DinB
MRRCFLSLTITGLCLGSLHAQPAAGSPVGFAAEAKQSYTMIRNNITKAAEKMPEENYSFKPSPDVRNFGQLISHIADAQTRFCSMVNGSPKQSDTASKTSKADLVAALKDSFNECDKAYDSVTLSNAGETIGSGRMQRSKLSMLWFNTSHDNEMYGTMAVYMRSKGLVPPSSEGR